MAMFLSMLLLMRLDYASVSADESAYLCIFASTGPYAVAPKEALLLKILCCRSKTIAG